jgi:hypothetical protein
MKTSYVYTEYPLGEPFIDQICQKRNGPIFGYSEGSRKVFNKGDCVDMSRLFSYQLKGYNGNVLED